MIPHAGVRRLVVDAEHEACLGGGFSSTAARLRLIEGDRRLMTKGSTSAPRE